MVGRYGHHNPDETYVEHKYPEQLFDTGRPERMGGRDPGLTLD